MAAQQRGHTNDAREVAFDLLRLDERAAATARHPTYDTGLLQRSQRLPDCRATDTEIFGQLSLGAEPLTGPQTTAADLLEQPETRGLGGRTTLARTRGQIPSKAAADSGSTWPPSTTRLCPVM